MAQSDYAFKILAARNENIDRIADAVYAAFIASGGSGASIDCTGYAGCPGSGYLASYAGQERSYDADGFSDFHVRAYVAGRLGKVNLGDYYGLWARDGIVFCDVSKHFTDRDECIAFAAENEQIACFDCAACADFDVRYA